MPDAASQAGTSPGFGQTLPIFGRYDVMDQFVETIVPIVEGAPFAKSLSAELGFRYSDYSTSGNTNSYKYGLNWEPTDELRVRGMFQRAVRAANVGELFEPRVPGTGDLLVDPCAGAGVTGRLAALCVATGVPAGTIAGGTLSQPTSGQINNFTGGNANLRPEEADTVTLGFVYRPKFAEGLAITVDYYDIQIDDAISVRPAADIVDGCYNIARNASASPLATDCTFILRNPLNGTMEGDLVYGVEQITQNIGSVHSEGIDYSISYPFEFTAGTLTLSIDGTHVIEQSYVPSAGGAVTDCVGFYGKKCGLPSTVSSSTGGPTPEDHFVQRTSWVSGPFSAGADIRYLSGSKVNEDQAADTAPPSNEIPGYAYLDVDFSWQVTPLLKVRAGAMNVLNEAPPLVVTETGSTTFNSGNTYPSTYDVLGRVLTVGFSAKF
jgi:outer membrane receptor protein involved in Fe transport